MTESPDFPWELQSEITSKNFTLDDLLDLYAWAIRQGWKPDSIRLGEFGGGIIDEK